MPFTLNESSALSKSLEYATSPAFILDQDSAGRHVQQPTMSAPRASRSTFLTATTWPVELIVALYTCGMRHVQPWYTIVSQAGQISPSTLQ